MSSKRAPGARQRSCDACGETGKLLHKQDDGVYITTEWLCEDCVLPVERRGNWPRAGVTDCGP